MNQKSNSIFSEKNLAYVSILLSISLLQMSGMNISPALQTISLRFPEVSSETIQTLVTLPSLFMVFSSFIAAPLSRLISKKRTILLGSLFFVVSGMIPIFWEGFQVLRISRMLIGIGVGMFLPINTTLLFTFFTDEEQRKTVIGWQSCASATGNIIATNLAGILVAINYKLTYLVHLVGLITFFINLILLPQDSPSENKTAPTNEKKSILSVLNGNSILWLLIVFFYMGYLNCFSTKISLLVESQGVGTSAVSAMGISMLTVGSFLGGLFFGKLSKLFGKFTLFVGFLVSSIGILSLGVAGNPFPVYLSGFCTGLGLALESPVVVLGLLDKAEPEARMTLTALSTALSNLGLSLSPYITSFTTILFCGRDKTLREEYVIAAIVLCCMAVVALIFTFLNKKDTEIEKR